MSRLTKEQKYTIRVMIEQNYSQKIISETIGKSKSLISRELKRNCDNRRGKYTNDLAKRKYESRMKKKA
ncbi:MAG: helix-turn-helix domain-containing protein [Paludibacteraceae bacterium]|nr:helix-turn-helix domain-containing protein [Paludibacteraceae bacterium]